MSAIEYSPAATIRRHRYHFLDGVRGVAALAVVVWHTNVSWPRAFHPASSYLAVDLFFILSGFVIAYAYGEKLDRGLSTFEFMRVRIIRLYPLFFLFCALKIAALMVAWALHHRLPDPWTPASFLSSLVFNLLFLPVPAHLGPIQAPMAALFPFDDPSWSLFFELFINLVFALVWTRLSSKVLGWICLVAAAGVIATSLAYGNLDAGFTWASFPGGFARVFFSFPAGILLYRLSRGRAPLHLPPLLLMAVPAILFLVPVSGPARQIFDPVAVMVIFPALVFVGSLVSVRGRLVPIFNSLGITSYAVYVGHRFLHNGFVVAVNKTALPAQWSGPVFIALLLAVTWLLDNFYDAPARKWLTRHLIARSPQSDRNGTMPRP